MGGDGALEQSSSSSCANSLSSDPGASPSTSLLSDPQHDQQYVAPPLLPLLSSPGGKPVPFIPVLDEHFQTWFKKDSLWQLKTFRDTFDGSDLRAHKEEGVLRSILRQIFHRPVHRIKATDVDPAVTHCVDFGTGGLSGIGGLTAYNLQGRGVRVIIASGMHRETAELYDLHKVQSEERWSDAFRPRLVKTE
ncbi:hypothetical protein A4X13_0g8716, partial [Tilletia indica]